jgi:hypothetical protein
MLKLMVVCEEWRPDDGDDLMVLLAVNYAVRGLIERFGFAPGDRHEMTLDEIRAWVGTMGADALVAVVLTAEPPTVEEAREMDREYMAGAAMPARFSDDWIHEIGPKSAAAIVAAQEHGADLVVMLPPARLHAMIKDAKETAALIEDDGQRQAFIDGLTFSFRCGDDRVRVPVKALADGPDAVAARLFAELRKNATPL